VLEKVFRDKIFISDFELPFPIRRRTYIMDAFPLLEEDGVINNIGVIIKNIYKGDQAYRITEYEFLKVQEYKRTHPNFSKERPGLFDSLILIEQSYYTEERKNVRGTKIQVCIYGFTRVSHAAEHRTFLGLFDRKVYFRRRPVKAGKTLATHRIIRKHAY
jgi:hypothetical protein